MSQPDNHSSRSTSPRPRFTLRQIVAVLAIVFSSGVLLNQVALRLVGFVTTASPSTAPEALPVSPNDQSITSENPRDSIPVATASSTWEPLPSSSWRSNWTNPIAPAYWHVEGWQFTEAELMSASSGRSQATFRQPFAAVSVSMKVSQSAADHLPVEVVTGSQFEVALVDSSNLPELRAVLFHDRAELNAVIGRESVLLKDTPLETTNRTGYLRLVLTPNRLLAYWDEQVLWNVTRPMSLVNRQVFVQVATEQRCVTLSELRFDGEY